MPAPVSSASGFRVRSWFPRRHRMPHPHRRCSPPPSAPVSSSVRAWSPPPRPSLDSAPPSHPPRACAPGTGRPPRPRRPKRLLSGIRRCSRPRACPASPPGRHKPGVCRSATRGPRTAGGQRGASDSSASPTTMPRRRQKRIGSPPPGSSPAPWLRPVPPRCLPGRPRPPAHPRCPKPDTSIRNVPPVPDPERSFLQVRPLRPPSRFPAKGFAWKHLAALSFLGPQTTPASRRPSPAPARFASFISEYLRESTTPWAPATKAALTAWRTSSGVVCFWPASVGTSMSMPG